VTLLFNSECRTEPEIIKARKYGRDTGLVVGQRAVGDVQIQEHEARTRQEDRRKMSDSAWTLFRA
jgi:hypothetical protein